MYRKEKFFKVKLFIFQVEFIFNFKKKKKFKCEKGRKSFFFNKVSLFYLNYILHKINFIFFCSRKKESTG